MNITDFSTLIEYYIKFNRIQRNNNIQSQNTDFWNIYDSNYVGFYNKIASFLTHTESITYTERNNNITLELLNMQIVSLENMINEIKEDFTNWNNVTGEMSM